MILRTCSLRFPLYSSINFLFSGIRDSFIIPHYFRTKTMYPPILMEGIPAYVRQFFYRPWFIHISYCCCSKYLINSCSSCSENNEILQDNWFIGGGANAGTPNLSNGVTVAVLLLHCYCAGNAPHSSLAWINRDGWISEGRGLHCINDWTN
jgi:hypothetical protein